MKSFELHPFLHKNMTHLSHITSDGLRGREKLNVTKNFENHNAVQFVSKATFMIPKSVPLESGQGKQIC